MPNTRAMSRCARVATFLVLAVSTQLTGCMHAAHALLSPAMDAGFKSAVEANATPESMGVSTAQYRGYNCSELAGLADTMRKHQVDPSYDTLTQKTFGWHVDAIQKVWSENGCDGSASARAGSGAAATAKQGRLMALYFYCYLTDTDERKTVASQVFARTVDPGDGSRLGTAYSAEFSWVTNMHGVRSPGGPTCVFEDSLQKAEQARARYRSLFSGLTLKFVDVAWEPAPRPSASTKAGPVASAALTAAEPAASSNPGLHVPAVGAHFEPVGDQAAKSAGLEPAHGASIVAVTADSPAARAGLRPKDIVTEIAGQAIVRPDDVQAAASRLRVGFKAPVQVRRGRKTLEMLVQIGSTPAVSAPSTAAPAVASSTVLPLAVASTPTSPNQCVMWIFKGTDSPPKDGVMVRFELPRGDLKKTQAAFDGYLRFIQQKEAGKWHLDFKPALYSEAFSYASAVRVFGTTQMALMVCKDSSEAIEKAFPFLKAGESPLRSVQWSPD